MQVQVNDTVSEMQQPEKIAMAGMSTQEERENGTGARNPLEKEALTVLVGQGMRNTSPLEMMSLNHLISMPLVEGVKHTRSTGTSPINLGYATDT